VRSPSKAENSRQRSLFYFGSTALILVVLGFVFASNAAVVNETKLIHTKTFAQPAVLADQMRLHWARDWGTMRIPFNHRDY
jgi:hypothetical protein